MATPVNRTQTYFADHCDDFSHDAINRYLKADRVTSAQVWEAARPHLELSHKGYLIFDDSVMDKSHSRQINVARQQWSGNEKRTIRGIGVVTCVYVNPESKKFWIVDYRIFAPNQDGKTKIEHVHEMLRRALERCAVGEFKFQTVLMDSWYATESLMTAIDRAGKYFCCPIKSNRNIQDVEEDDPEWTPHWCSYQRADRVSWSKDQEEHGREVHLKKCPKAFRVKMFRIALSTERTELIVTNDPALLTTDDVRSTCAIRWKVEVFHREYKQITGVEDCQCRVGRAQRNHIGCAMLIWLRMKHLAEEAGTTIYQLKERLLSDYMRRELRSPTLTFA